MVSMNLLRLLTLPLILCWCLTSSAADESSIHLDTTPDLNAWGLEVGFGSQPYMESSVRFAVISPYLFEAAYEVQWRATLDYSVKRLQALNTSSIGDLAFSMESNNKLYKDLVYSYARFGLGALFFAGSAIYDGTILTLPISLGVNIITGNTKKAVLSYFVDYRFMFSNYDIQKSLPNQVGVGIDPKALFSVTTTIGVRIIF